jgi:hypothetical protein
VLNSRPFGTADGLRRVAEDSGREIDQAIEALARWRRDETLADRERVAIEQILAAGQNVGDFESARLLAWGLIHGLSSNADWPEDVRARKIAELTALLALEFPTPAYPSPPAQEKTFWQTSLAAAPATDIGRVRAAFELPPAARKPAPTVIEVIPTPR